MEKKINKILQYYDEKFFVEKVEIDQQGRYGLHYDGLNFDYFYEDSIYSIDYLSVEDYFDEKLNGIEYNETGSLLSQYVNISIEEKFLVISAILNLLKKSTYSQEISEEVLNKSLKYLARIGLKVQEEDGIISISTEMKIFSGSYCDILSYNNQFYKKILKNSFQKEPQWIKRFKYEFQNMIKLSDSPYVLKVFNYDNITNSYLMEICDCNLCDYLKDNPFMRNKELETIIFDLINGMLVVHNNGIIHRDLHLGNILVKDGKIILADFGLSKDTMIVHSLKSTSTPKNSHFFMDPIGLSDFNKLDKLSDIYSLGKIIDYITKDSDLNEKLSFIINKASDREREKRYKNLNDMKVDIEEILNDLSEIQQQTYIEKKILNGTVSPKVEVFVLKLSEENQLAKYIVYKKHFDFWNILIQLKETNQSIVLKNIRDNYVEATGTGKFENYDLFANIMYNYIKNSREIILQTIAYDVLSGCAGYRWKAKNLLDEVDLKYPILVKT